MNRAILFSLATLSMALGAASLQAQLVFVDADFGTNTSPDTADAATAAQDDLWGLRTGFGANNTIFEVSGNSGEEDAPEIMTLISGLTPGQSYNVWVNFYDVANDSGQNWAIRAGFTSGSLALFANGDDGGATALEATSAELASNFIYVADPKFDDGGNRLLYAGSLGGTLANANGEIPVFIDDIPATFASNNRTWYDGVSYEVIPEPSTYAILFGATVLVYAGVRRRRNR